MLIGDILWKMCLWPNAFASNPLQVIIQGSLRWYCDALALDCCDRDCGGESQMWQQEVHHTWSPFQSGSSTLIQDGCLAMPLSLTLPRQEGFGFFRWSWCYTMLLTCTHTLTVDNTDNTDVHWLSLSLCWGYWFSINMLSVWSPLFVMNCKRVHDSILNMTV